MSDAAVTRPSVLSSRPVVGLDAAVARLAGSARERGVDRAVYLLSRAADHSMLWHGINVADAVLGGPSHVRPALRRSVILALEQAVVNGPVKALVRRDRPAERDDHPHALRAPRTSSFPSGHASAGACAATLLTRDLGAGPLWWGLALTVAWTRIHIGVHHASDVAAGVAVGRTLAAVGAAVWPPANGRGSGPDTG